MWFETVDNKQISQERQKARKLRKTAWWQAHLNRGICYYCGNVFKQDEMTMDHKIPVARGGKSNKSNIVPACKECNNKKKALTPVDMILENS